MSQKSKGLWDCYANKLDNLEDVDKFLQAYNLPRLNHGEIRNLNRLLTSEEIEAAMKNLPTKKRLGPLGFSGESYQTFKELTPSLFKLLERIKERTLPNSFFEDSVTDPKNHTKTQDKTKWNKLENCIPVSLMNNDAKTLNKILANWIHQCIRIITYQTKWNS